MTLDISQEQLRDAANQSMLDMIKTFHEMDLGGPFATTFHHAAYRRLDEICEWIKQLTAERNEARAASKEMLALLLPFKAEYEKKYPWLK